MAAEAGTAPAATATAAYRYFVVAAAAARTYASLCLPVRSLTVSHSLSFVLFDVVVVNCSSLLSCTLHNAPLITAEWESE